MKLLNGIALATLTSLWVGGSWVDPVLGCTQRESLGPAQPSQIHTVATGLEKRQSNQEDVFASSQLTPNDRSIEDYVQIGLAGNPAVAEARYQIEATRQRIAQVRSLPDPMVSTNTFFAPVQTAAGEQTFSLGVNQKFTNADRRSTQAEMIQEEVAAASANLAQVQIELAESIRSACYQLLFIRKSIQIVVEDQKTLAQIEEVILRQYEVKQSVSQQDVLNVQVEQSSIENQLTQLRQQGITYQTRLARLLHLAPNTHLQISDTLEQNSRQFSVEQLLEQAAMLRPDLHMQLAAINRNRKSVHLAELAGKPDFTVGLNWIATSSNGISPVRNGDDALVLGIGFNLPIYKNRIQAGVCEAQANLRAAENRYASMQDKAAEEVFNLTAQIESTQSTLGLLQQDIIPKAERTLDLTITGYSDGKITFVQLMENWRAVLKYRVAQANLQSQYNQQLSSLVRSIGQLQADLK